MHTDVQVFQAVQMMTKHDGISLHEFALKSPHVPAFCLNCWLEKDLQYGETERRKERDVWNTLKLQIAITQT